MLLRLSSEVVRLFLKIVLRSVLLLVLKSFFARRGAVLKKVFTKTNGDEVLSKKKLQVSVLEFFD